MRAPECAGTDGAGLEVGPPGPPSPFGRRTCSGAALPDVGGAPGAPIARPRLLERRRREDVGARGWGPRSPPGSRPSCTAFPRASSCPRIVAASRGRGDRKSRRRGRLWPGCDVRVQPSEWEPGGRCVRRGKSWKTQPAQEGLDIWWWGEADRLED